MLSPFPRNDLEKSKTAIMPDENFPVEPRNTTRGSCNQQWPILLCPTPLGLTAPPFSNHFP